MGFGKKLEEKMSQKGLKQADIVRATGISKTTLSSMINRDNTKVDVEIFIRICDALGCKPEDFADEILSNSANQSQSLTATENQLLEDFRELDQDGQAKLIAYADDMAQLSRLKKRNTPMESKENA